MRLAIELYNHTLIQCCVGSFIGVRSWEARVAHEKQKISENIALIQFGSQMKTNAIFCIEFILLRSHLLSSVNSFLSSFSCFKSIALSSAPQQDNDDDSDNVLLQHKFDLAFFCRNSHDLVNHENLKLSSSSMQRS